MFWGLKESVAKINTLGLLLGLGGTERADSLHFTIIKKDKLIIKKEYINRLFIIPMAIMVVTKTK